LADEFRQGSKKSIISFQSCKVFQESVLAGSGRIHDKPVSNAWLTLDILWIRRIITEFLAEVANINA
jgi:hypothetical protein